MRAGFAARPVANGAGGGLCRTLAGGGRSRAGDLSWEVITNLGAMRAALQVHFSRQSRYGLLHVPAVLRDSL
jgi:hypothetical protein